MAAVGKLQRQDIRSKNKMRSQQGIKTGLPSRSARAKRRRAEALADIAAKQQEKKNPHADDA